MAVKKNSYVTAKIDLAKSKLDELEKYLSNNPYNEIVDRKEMMKTKTGGSYFAVVQTIEAIQKNWRETFKEYLAMTEIVKKLEKEEELEQKSARGGDDIPESMQE